jgi:MOSC domain-containing protein YiiM
MTVFSVNIAPPREVLGQGRPLTTGISKQPVAGHVRVGRLNVDGDRGRDRQVARTGRGARAVWLALASGMR